MEVILSIIGFFVVFHVVTSLIGSGAKAAKAGIMTATGKDSFEDNWARTTTGLPPQKMELVTEDVESESGATFNVKKVMYRGLLPNSEPTKMGSSWCIQMQSPIRMMVAPPIGRLPSRERSHTPTPTHTATSTSSTP